MNFEPIDGWGQLPDGWRYVECAGVAVDKQDNVFVFTRGRAPGHRLRPRRPLPPLVGRGRGPPRPRHHHRRRRDGVAHRRPPPHRPQVHAGRQAPAHHRRPGHSRAELQGGKPFNRPTHVAICPRTRLPLRLGRLRQLPRPQVRARRQARDVLGRAGHRSRPVQPAPQPGDGLATDSSTWPTARTIACRSSTARVGTRASGTTSIARAGSSSDRGTTTTSTSASSAPTSPSTADAESRAARDGARRQGRSGSRASAARSRARSRVSSSPRTTVVADSRGRRLRGRGLVHQPREPRDAAARDPLPPEVQANFL